MTSQAWPPLEFASWAPTKRSLHAYAQMLGKLRLGLAPVQPNWMFTSLALTPRGFTTGPMPVSSRTLAVSLDLFDGAMLFETSAGERKRIEIASPRTLATVFADLHTALRALGIETTISPVPQEVPDTTPFDRDERPAVFEPVDAQRWHAVVTSTNNVFDVWRTHFFGRTGLQLWWGAFDFALLLFNGEHVPAPVDRGYLMKYDLDAAMMNVGFYPGDDANAAMFYGYIYPQPASCSSIAIAPAEATWSQALGEWVLPYEIVRNASDPAAALRAFLDAIYGICGSASGWNHPDLRYVAPPLRR